MRCREETRYLILGASTGSAGGSMGAGAGGSSFASSCDSFWDHDRASIEVEPDDDDDDDDDTVFRWYIPERVEPDAMPMQSDESWSSKVYFFLFFFPFFFSFFVLHFFSVEGLVVEKHHSSETSAGGRGSARSETACFPPLLEVRSISPRGILRALRQGEKKLLTSALAETIRFSHLHSIPQTARWGCRG